MTATPDSPVAALDRGQLAVLLREYLLHGHLQDRVGVPLLFQYGVDREGTQDIAIDEWMAASPIYSVRTQELLGFRGDTVDVILKNLQFDIGSPPQYMDFRLKHLDDHHAEFWLDHCGALLDVEPMGEEWVRGMCHTIEDPTFDATALAANPHAMIRPIHRPPRVPADRMPHCHWTITIDESHPTPAPHPNLEIVRASLAAQAPVPVIEAAPGADGRTAYSDAVDPDLRFEEFSRAALLALLSEVARQSYLLFRSYLLAVTQRVGEEPAAEVGPRVLTGLAPVTAGRIVDAFDVPRDLDGIAFVLGVHPSFQPPGYVTPTVTRRGDRVRFALAPSDVFAEGDDLHWLAGLGQADDRSIDALVRAVHPQARAVPVPTAADEVVAYEIVIDPDREPGPDEPETALARFSTGAGFTFR
jgi:hypothetical protein